ncbi:Mitogen-activated protein kinase kinase kinase 3 [Diplonema papillatum]|nr:Mitogen-activated protein kinase kinase kinase 3 [Diplonema papillatum]
MKSQATYISTLETTLVPSQTLEQIPCPQDEDEEASGCWGVLRRTAGEKVDDVYVLKNSSSCTAGRLKSNTVELKDQRVSSVHFKIERETDGRLDNGIALPATITDLSTNGTFVNGHRLVKNRVHHLRNGDEIGVVQLSVGSLSERYAFSFTFNSHKDISRIPTILPPRSKPNRPITWQKGDLIGSGGYSSVYLGIDCNTSELLAIKGIFLSEAESKPVMEEINLLKRLNHPNIVRYKGSSTDAVNQKLHIVMEYVPGGSLAQLIARFGRFHEVVISNYCTQILQGLQYLHDSLVVHRDIKAANILISQCGIAKLSDFGSALSLASKKQVPGSDGQAARIVGTPLWMAPETVSLNEVSYASDIWSVGCVVLEMCTAKHPWSELNFDNPVAALYYIGRTTAPPQLPTNASVELRSFLESCLQVKREKRLSCKALQRHPFLVRSASVAGMELKGGQHNVDGISPKKRRGDNGLAINSLRQPCLGGDEDMETVSGQYSGCFSMESGFDNDVIAFGSGAMDQGVWKRSVSEHVGFFKQQGHLDKIDKLRQSALSQPPIPSTPPQSTEDQRMERVLSGKRKRHDEFPRSQEPRRSTGLTTDMDRLNLSPGT